MGRDNKYGKGLKLNDKKQSKTKDNGKISDNYIAHDIKLNIYYIYLFRSSEGG